MENAFSLVILPIKPLSVPRSKTNTPNNEKDRERGCGCVSGLGGRQKKDNVVSLSRRPFPSDVEIRLMLPFATRT